ncbi:hypothetical protein ES708_00720 [subsurface metagenome]
MEINEELTYAVRVYAQLVSGNDLSLIRSKAHDKVCELLGINSYDWNPFEEYKKKGWPSERDCLKIIWDSLKAYEPPPKNVITRLKIPGREP